MRLSLVAALSVLSVAGCRDEVPPPIHLEDPVDVYAEADTSEAIPDTIHVTEEDIMEAVLSGAFLLQAVFGDTTGLACWADTTCRAEMMADTTGQDSVDTVGP